MDGWMRPWFDVTSLLHESSQREPEAVEDGEVVGDGRPVCVVLYVPLKGREPVVWCGVVWCGVVWCGVVWCGVVSVVWCGVSGVVWCGVVWCGVV